MIISLVIYIVFILISLAVRKYLIKKIIDRKVKYLLILIYLVLIYPLMETLNYIFNFLKIKGIYFGLGHANIYLILLLILCYITGVIISISVIRAKPSLPHD